MTALNTVALCTGRAKEFARVGRVFAASCAETVSDALFARWTDRVEKASHQRKKLFQQCRIPVFVFGHTPDWSSMWLGYLIA